MRGRLVELFLLWGVTKNEGGRQVRDCVARRREIKKSVCKGRCFPFSPTPYHVRLDRAVRGGVRHAGQGEPGAHLVVVQEGLVGLVDGAGGDLARAGRARARAAGVGQVDATLL